MPPPLKRPSNVVRAIFFFVGSIVVFLIIIQIQASRYVHQRGGFVTSPSSRSNFLILIPVKGTNANRQQRLVSNLCSLTYPAHSQMSVSFLVDEPSFQLVTSSKSVLLGCGITDVSLLPDLPRFSSPPVSESLRHSVSSQLSRRALLSEARNYLLVSSLRGAHGHVLWLDSDLLSFPPDVVRDLQAADGDVVVPLCSTAEWDDEIDGEDDRQPRAYDLNSWKESKESEEMVRNLPKDKALFEGYEDNHRLHMDDLRKLLLLESQGGVDKNRAVEIDGVGGVSVGRALLFTFLTMCFSKNTNVRANNASPISISISLSLSLSL